MDNIITIIWLNEIRWTVNANIFNIQVKWKIYYSMNLLSSGTCNYRIFARGKQVINWWLEKETVKCHISFVQRQIFKILLRQSNPRIYKPTNLLILRKPRKLNPTKIKYFTVPQYQFSRNKVLRRQQSLPSTNQIEVASINECVKSKVKVYVSTDYNKHTDTGGMTIVLMTFVSEN